VVAGTGGDAGKTLVSLALAAAWRARGLAVAAFKKGPDYIDRAWLSWAAGGEARNLDPYLMAEPALLSSFGQGAAGARVSLVEGNRGLYDGLDGAGTYSTAELAKALAAPVVLLLDATKVTRTAAAVALGMQRMDPGCPLRAVVLNRVRGARHERVITEAVRQATGLPVLGVIPRDPELASLLPDRHLGLVPPAEHVGTARLGTRLAALAEQALDLDRLLALADEAPPFPAPAPFATPARPGGPRPDEAAAAPAGPPTAPRVRIGVFRDRAFTFYYPENLEALRRAGAELVPIRPTRDPALPAVDALYLGGGFPETEAAELVANAPLRAAVRGAAQQGLPIYAECGGLMYLCRAFWWQGERHDMAGVFPLELEVTARPQGHGYMEVEVDRDTPLFPRGTRLRGHEFHYSRIIDANVDISTAYAVRRGTGTGAGRDGLQHRNTLASYLHLHALGAEPWAPALVALAAGQREPL
jgi:cobyrinic acid a,c-diamide synthase